MGGGFSMILMLVLLGGMLFFMNRTQKKQQQKRQETLDNMRTGSKVVTIGGLHGVISRINSEKNTVEIDCEGIYLEFNRNAIASVQPPENDVTVETVTTDNGVQAEETTVVESADQTESAETTEDSKTEENE